MKILSAEQIKQLDEFTIKHRPIDSIDLMENAALKCCNWILKNCNTKRYIVFCGNGNNGGDGLAIARLLNNSGKEVIVLFLDDKKKSSDNGINFNRLPQEIRKISIGVNTDEFNFIDKEDVIIDALFGIGLSKQVEGKYEKIILSINNLKNIIVSIDMPSGLLSENEMPKNSNFIRATHTLTFHCPKLNMLLPHYGNYFGNIHILDIGLMTEFESRSNCKYELLTLNTIKSIFKKRVKFSHKGLYGHSLIIAGSYGKAGASVLAAKGCLRSGSGLLSIFTPKFNFGILQTSLPEAMLIPSDEEYILSGKIDYEKYDAIAIGPGIGTEKQTQNLCKLLIQNATCPLVIDADAINILSENKTWLSFLPDYSILTPHPKEFERLAGKWSSDYDCMQMQIDFSVKHNCLVVLKGAHTKISTPSGIIYFNSTGNAGMSTGGSGDVLTGIICAFISQKYGPFEAALLGTYIHGLAGDLAAQDKTFNSLLASDIVENLAEAFKVIEKNN